MIYKLTEWQDVNTGRWHCNCIDALGQGSGYWWHPARIMGISPAKYLQWVIDNYKPDKINHNLDGSVIWFEWNSQITMRLYKNKINALARKVNYQI